MKRVALLFAVAVALTMPTQAEAGPIRNVLAKIVERLKPGRAAACGTCAAGQCDSGACAPGCANGQCSRK